MLNGIPLDTIHHGRGLRQGDPLSLLLFILVVDPLHRLLHVAMERGCLSKLTGKAARFRASLYVDDAIIFLKLTHGGCYKPQTSITQLWGGERLGDQPPKYERNGNQMWQFGPRLHSR
jgi:hypothetical protein